MPSAGREADDVRGELPVINGGIGRCSRRVDEGHGGCRRLQMAAGGSLQLTGGGDGGGGGGGDGGGGDGEGGDLGIGGGEGPRTALQSA